MRHSTGRALTVLSLFRKLTSSGPERYTLPLPFFTVSCTTRALVYSAYLPAAMHVSHCTQYAHDEIELN
jgi:hypothetical protein